MISVLSGFVSLIRSTFDLDIIIVPVSFAVIASVAYILTGIIKGRG